MDTSLSSSVPGKIRTCQGGALEPVEGVEEPVGSGRSASILARAQPLQGLKWGRAGIRPQHHSVAFLKWSIGPGPRFFLSIRHVFDLLAIMYRSRHT